MADLTYLALVLGFFLVAAGLLRACELIIGPDDPVVRADANQEAEVVQS